jgi:hypothetical protein
MTDVEVSELTLDDEEFSTAFGSLTTQFDNIDLAPEEPDPLDLPAPHRLARHGLLPGPGRIAPARAFAGPLLHF